MFGNCLSINKTVVGHFLLQVLYFEVITSSMSEQQVKV